MEGEVARVDPNTADLDTLRQLPGVGPALGQRILEARPFHSLEDMRRVPGLGQAVLARLEPYLQFTVGPLGAQVEAEGLGAASGAAGAPAPTSAGQAAPVRKPPPAITRLEALRYAAATATGSVIVAVLLTLAILAGINGSLDAGRNRTVRQIRVQVDQASATIDTVAGSLESIDGRLQALEGLTGRMSAVEGEIAEMRGDLDAALSQVGAMQTALADVEAGMQDLESRFGRFDQFLNGLRDLLGPSTATPEPGSVP